MTRHGRSTDGKTSDIVNAGWSNRLGGVLAIVGVTGFIVIVLVLHLIQVDYEPARRLIVDLYQVEDQNDDDEARDANDGEHTPEAI